MTTSQLAELLSLFDELLNKPSAGAAPEAGTVRTVIHELSVIYEAAQTETSNILIKNDSHGINPLRKILNERLKEFKSGKSITVLGNAIHDLIQSLEKFPLDGNGNCWVDLRGVLHEFSNKLDRFYEKQTPESFLDLTASATTLESWIASATITSNNLRTHLLPARNDDPEFNARRCCIYVKSEDDSLEDFIARSEALQQIVDTFVSLQGFPDEDRKISIIKLEYGTWWIDFITANPKLTTMVAGFLFYMIKKATPRAKLQSDTKQAESLQGISDWLKEQGIDTTQVNQKLTSATVNLAAKFERLTRDGVNVKVNDTNAIIEEQHQLPEHKMPLQLEEPDEDTQSDQS